MKVLEHAGECTYLSVLVGDHHCESFRVRGFRIWVKGPWGFLGMFCVSGEKFLERIVSKSSLRSIHMSSPQ